MCRPSAQDRGAWPAREGCCGIPPWSPLHLDLEGYPLQESSIHQVRWIKVGGEDDQLLERDLDRLACYET